MKRARFIKLVMSYGIQRNAAEHLAAMVNVYGSYQRLFNVYKPNLMIKKYLAKFKKGVARVVKEITLVLSYFLNKIESILNGVD